MGMKVVTVKMPHKLVELIDEVARLKGISRSELIRVAIEQYLRSMDTRTPKVDPKHVVL